jgi:hypothetical protein
MNVSPRPSRSPSSSSPSAGRGAADQSRRTVANEAFAAQTATVILAAFILVLLIICVHMF